MKTKVQAQRKFAQGAYVPPALNVSGGGIDRRTEISPIKEKSVFHNKTSARSLLDIVAFKNLHKHAQPIVLLERLENSHPLCSKDRSNPIALAKPSGVTINKTSHEPIPPVSNATHSSPMSRDRTRNARIITPRLPMHLRSRVVTYGERKKVLVSKKKNFENREKNIVKIRNSRELRKKKRPDNYSDDFSIDDDKPLMFFRQKSLSLKKDASMKQRKINNKRPKSVKNSEPKPRNKTKIVRPGLNLQGKDAVKRSSSCLDQSAVQGPASCRTNINPIPGLPSSNKNISPILEAAPSNKDVIPVPETSPTTTKTNPVSGLPTRNTNTNTTPLSSQAKEEGQNLEPSFPNKNVDFVPGTVTPNVNANLIKVLSTSNLIVDANVRPAFAGMNMDTSGGQVPDKIDVNPYSWPASHMNMETIPVQTFPNGNMGPIPVTSPPGINVNPITGPQSQIYVVNVPGSSSNIYVVPVPGASTFAYATPVPAPTSTNLYVDSIPGPSSLNIYKDPVPGPSCTGVYAVATSAPSTNICSDNDRGPLSSNIYTGNVSEPSASMPCATSGSLPSCLNTHPALASGCSSPNASTASTASSPSSNQVPTASSSEIYSHPVPGTSSSSVCSDPIPNTSSNGRNKRTIAKQRRKSSTKSASSLTRKRPMALRAPFYGIKMIETWLSSDFRVVTAPPPPPPPKKKSNDPSEARGVTMSPEPEIDETEQCIGAKFSTIKDIINYGPSYFDCLCLQCDHCNYIYKMLNKYKQDSSAARHVEVGMRKRKHEESLTVERQEASDSMVIEVSDSEDINTIDLTGDTDDLMQDSEASNCSPKPANSSNPQPENGSQQNEAQRDSPGERLQNQLARNLAQRIQTQQSQRRIQQRQRQRVGRQAGSSLRGRQRIVPRAVQRPLRRVVVNKVVNRRSLTRYSYQTSKHSDNVSRILRDKIITAPVFYPTLEEFSDPMAYLEKIMKFTKKYGIFKLVAPDEYEPTCTISENFKFSTSHQYIARFFNRWGPAARELCTMRAYLATQNVHFKRGPLLGGLEVDLPKVFHIVQRLGGLKTVMDKKKWHRIAEELNLRNLRNPEKKFDNLFLKYLLPYNSLTKRERQDMMMKVEQRWIKKNNRLMKRVVNPLYRQKRMLGEIESSDEEAEDEDYLTEALNLAEDCSQLGRKMGLEAFKKIAGTAFNMYFPDEKAQPTVAEIEEKYWNIVLLGTQHVSVNTAFIESGVEGNISPKSKTSDAITTSPWYLKNLSTDKSNVLRLLGSLAGMTVPSLHVGMVFSTSCWHRDPHGLPWMDYLHQGTEKIWYGVPSHEGQNFRCALETLCPTLCQNKTLWLPSEIAMTPLNLLLDRNIKLTRCVQRPGEFVFVNPQAYSSSVSTDFTVSESVYFATESYFENVNQAFQELKESCEPSSFSLEQLLISAAKDPHLSPNVLEHVNKHLNDIVSEELSFRRALTDLKVPLLLNKNRPTIWSARDDDECQVCRTALYLSRVTGLFKNASVCLQHALRLINLKKGAELKALIATLAMEVTISNQELHDIVVKLQRRLSQRAK
ncbi:hypothetical protein KGM_203332 [Danaus plexippus plexippus]|uniref:Protein Jumonji n=1 Tax=Danaus plexippus plexippus TaxID=278856 RepID=A0A212EQK4_DANPL|nr:hypothetical protein KGM_203332 [Danaus plexippus plexippus]